MSHEVVTTRRGARAMLDHATGEVMHPVVGPLVEAGALYLEPSRLEARLAEDTPRPLVLLDVGLGAGSNAVAALRVSERLPSAARRLEIVSFDRTTAALRLALSHPSDFALDGGAGLAARALLERGEHETPRTHWRLVEGELPGALLAQPDASADVVFWDPFSPAANPDLWTMGAFEALRRTCSARCTVHTYGGATATRAALLLAGFFVGFGERIGADKQSTCAASDLADLERPLDARWLERLGRSSAPLPSDAPEGALERIALHPQFQ